MNCEQDRKETPLPLPELPWEILATILEEAARSNRPTTLNLTLVSKEVQHAVDQVLFKHISIAGSTTRQTTSMLTTMFSSPESVSPRLLRARTFIYSLYSENQIKWQLLFAIILGCPALRSLSVRLSHPQLFTLSSSTLCQLTDQFIPSPTYTLLTSESLCQPLFQTLTHLDFVGSLRTLNEMRDVWSRALFQLTHLRILVSDVSQDIWNFLAILSGFVRSLPGHLEIIILNPVLPSVMPNVSVETLYQEIQTGELDVRVILANSDNAWNTWETAEVIVASRRASSSLRTIKAGDQVA
ncbi:hypothetical protein DL96DRAFT_1277692 [Flagelloscypha sp. PMI_526]|nr:hypothetical protein DL96DRAFT_1277692 [Flagelloscypha sp. PMI_526]